MFALIPLHPFLPPEGVSCGPARAISMHAAGWAQAFALAQQPGAAPYRRARCLVIPQNSIALDSGREHGATPPPQGGVLIPCAGLAACSLFGLFVSVASTLCLCASGRYGAAPRCSCSCYVPRGRPSPPPPPRPLPLSPHVKCVPGFVCSALGTGYRVLRGTSASKEPHRRTRVYRSLRTRTHMKQAAAPPCPGSAKLHTTHGSPSIVGRRPPSWRLPFGLVCLDLNAHLAICDLSSPYVQRSLPGATCCGLLQSGHRAFPSRHPIPCHDGSQ